MGSCFPGSSSLLCCSVVCKYSLKYLFFLNFLYCIEIKYDAGCSGFALCWHHFCKHSVFSANDLTSFFYSRVQSKTFLQLQARSRDLIRACKLLILLNRP